MPDMTPNSEQLHRVVELSSGIRDVEPAAAGPPSPAQGGSSGLKIKMSRQNPVDKLKEALSSKTAFQKYYLVSVNGNKLNNA